MKQTSAYYTDRVFFFYQDRDKDREMEEVLENRFYNNKGVKLERVESEKEYDIITRTMLSDYDSLIEEAKELDYVFTEIKLDTWTAEHFHTRIQKLPDYEGEPENHSKTPFQNKNLRITDDLDLSLLKREYYDVKYGVITNIYKDLNSFATSLVGTEFRYGPEAVLSYGREKDFEKAEKSALFELLERHATYGIEKNVLCTSYNEVRGQDEFLNPSLFLHYAVPEAGRRKPFREEMNYFWCPIEEYRTKQECFIPTQFLDMAVRDKEIFVMESSNGVALGSSIAEARMFALLELIERDAFLTFWYKKVKLYEIEKDSLSEKIKREIEEFETEEKKVHLFDMTFDIPIPCILCMVIDTKGKINTYISTACHFDYQVAVKCAVNECLVGHRIYETNPLVEKKQFRSDEDVEKMFDHVCHAARKGYAKNYQFLFEENEPVRLDELYADKEYRSYLAFQNAEELVDAVIADFLKSHKHIYFADLTSKLSYHYGLYVAKALIPSMSTMSFGFQNRRIHRERIEGSLQNSKYKERSLVEGGNLYEHAHPFP